jgi:flagellar biosynthesis/type III secretory pathway M-ring protein FliF/YscJ
MTDFTETRSKLKKLAMAEDGDTPKRRAYYNLMEMMESHDKSSDFDQRVQLKANINRELARIEGLSQPR